MKFNIKTVIQSIENAKSRNLTLTQWVLSSEFGTPTESFEIYSFVCQFIRELHQKKNPKRFVELWNRIKFPTISQTPKSSVIAANLTGIDYGFDGKPVQAIRRIKVSMKAKNPATKFSMIMRGKKDK